MFAFTVDLGISIQEDNVAASSPKTMETSAAAEANGESLGKDAKPQAPAAKSRFFLTLSRPVPGRTGDQATDSSSGSVRLDVSSDKAPGNKDPSEPMALPVAAAPGHGPDKTPGQTPAQVEGLPAAPGPEHPPSESGAVTPAKPKDSSFFDKLFKLDKGRDKAPVDLPQEAESTEHPHPAAETPGLSTQSEDGPAERVRRSVLLLLQARGGVPGAVVGQDDRACLALPSLRGPDKVASLGPSRTPSTLEPGACPCFCGRNTCCQNNNICGICFM